MAKFIIGIDEVGRGPLAGPVIVCALFLPRGLRLRGPCALRDSKKLTGPQREAWYEWIKNQPLISYAVARVYPRGIERLNISQAANLAATKACRKILPLFEGEEKGGGVKVFLDGGLFLNPLKAISYKLVPQTIIKGDEKIPAIALASIVAKVVRDRFMAKLHKKFPEYGFDRHKGYGTRAHIAAIKKFGPAVVHRATFLKKI